MFRWRRKSSTPGDGQPESIRHYRITRKLGEGAMGVVFEALDERLERPVAIKLVRPILGNPTLRERLLREARAAASISHPNVCQVYELGEEGGDLFIAMELLAGEPLAERIARGPLPLAEGLQTALGILAALGALHARGIVHRDLKPSNVFLTPHGVKLLDFGLAKPVADQLGSGSRLSLPGTPVGTPRYMAPEQWESEPVGPSADLFSLGAILFEMLSGRHAFDGGNLVQIFHAVTHAQPPALSGGHEVIAADRVIQRALVKRPEQRYPDADSMAQDVRAALTLIDSGAPPRVRATRRVIVLPFRVLRPDPETDFLACSLPEAISASLSGLEALVVRSPTAAQGFTAERLDLKAIAEEADVDLVLVGTLLRAGGEVRVSTQLVEMPGGAVAYTRMAQVPLTDIFQLQDELTRQIVDALAIPLSARDHHLLSHDVPASAHAYELYLRANLLADTVTNPSRLATARNLYRACLEEDPRYAPAWARLARVHRVMAKWGYAPVTDEMRRAEEAFRKALEINPELPLAHNLYTYFEVEELGRAREAMLRLLGRIDTQAADPNLFAGLVVACRFCGLPQASLAADQRARRIDPTVRTSVSLTHWMLADYLQTARSDGEDLKILRHAALWMLGREEEALSGVQVLAPHWPSGPEHWFLTSLQAVFLGDREKCVLATTRLLEQGFHDPEGLLFCCVRNLARVGETGLALTTLARVVEGGFHCPTALVRDPWLDPLRAEPEFTRALRFAEERHAEALHAYIRAGGERILGVVG